LFAIKSDGYLILVYCGHHSYVITMLALYDEAKELSF
jgi:hypothetical protein